MINPVNYNSDTNLNNQSNDNILPRNNTSEKSSESDKYMNLVENEIKRYGHNLNDSLFMGSIINILDGLSSPNTFNKTLFIHILDFAKFDKEKPIKLLDFFHAYFTVYSTMRENRDKLAFENIETKRQIDILKNSLPQIQTSEIIKEDGLTSNSSLQIIFKSRKSKSDKGTDPINRIKNVKISFGILPPFNFSINETYIKKSIPIPNISHLDFPLYVSVITDIGEKRLDTLNVKELLDSPTTRDYEFFELSFLWINSLVSFINQKISLYEKDVKTSKDNIFILNTSINQMEMIFKGYFSQIPRSQYSTIIGGTIGNEMEVSDKIEKIVLKTIGKEIITTWDKIVYLMNKILLLSVFLEFFGKFDVLTVRLILIYFDNTSFYFVL